MRSTTRNRLPRRAWAACLPFFALLFPPTGFADSSGPRLAAYYDQFMAVCGGTAYAWHGSEVPRAALPGVRAVGVGKGNFYALTEHGVLRTWDDAPADAKHVLDGVVSFHAGRTGLLVILEDGSLWRVETASILGFGETLSDRPVPIAEGVRTAAVGDGAVYYVTRDGRLFVRGKAHRGQYGDGRLASSAHFVATAQDAVRVVAHTGHALYLATDGKVYGTGGNIYGPLGTHGLGDKADVWGLVFDGAVAVATGSRHTLAIRDDGSVWTWGDDDGVEPRRVLDGATAVAAGYDGSLALAQGKLWQWTTGSRPQSVMACD